MTASKMRGVSIALFLLLGPAAATPGQVRLYDQLRRLDADVLVAESNGGVERETVLVGHKSESVEARDWGPFDRTLDVRIDAYPDPFGIVSHGIASQSSTISPERFYGAGQVQVYAESDEGGSAGRGASTFRVEFFAKEPQRYHLGTEMYSDDFVGERFEGYVRRIQFTEDAPAVVLLDEGMFPKSSDPVPGWYEEFTGDLPAGFYVFEFFTSQQTDYGSDYNYEFEFTLTTVPEPAGAAAALLVSSWFVLRRRPRG